MRWQTLPDHRDETLCAGLPRRQAVRLRQIMRVALADAAQRSLCAAGRLHVMCQPVPGASEKAVRLQTLRITVPDTRET